MKIASLPASGTFSSLVKDKHPSQEEKKRQDQQQNKEGEKERESDRDPESFASEVKAAVRAFSGDVHAIAQGLKAEEVGTGPGLRVVLKDGMGAVVRQFTGEEFLQLRDAAQQGTGTHGKLLDRKL